MTLNGRPGRWVYGYRENNFYLDFAYAHATSSEKYFMYDPMNGTSQPAPTLNYTGNMAVMTLGFKF